MSPRELIQGMPVEVSPDGQVAAETAPETVKIRKGRWRVAAIAIFALCIDALAVRSISILAPFIRSGLALSDAQFGYVLGSLTTGTLLVVLPVGRLLDRLDARKSFPVMLTAAGLAFGLVSLQTTFAGLLAALFLLGVLRAGIIPLVNRLITAAFPPEQRGAMIGLIFAAVPLGGFLGAVALPALGNAFDWNICYRVLGLLALAGGLLSGRQIPHEEDGAAAVRPAGSLAAIRSATFIILAAAYGFYALSLSADTYVTLFLVDVVKVSAVAAGTFFGLIQLTGVGGRMLWGLLADRWFQKNRWALLALLNWLTVISFLLLTRLNSTSQGWMVAAVMALLGMSVASSWGILSTLLGDVVGAGAIAVATSVVFFITNISDIVGPILFGAALDATGSYPKTIAAFAGVAVCTGLTISGMAWRKRGSTDGGKEHRSWING